MSILKAIARQCLYASLLMAWHTSIVSAQTSAIPEYQVKAAFLFNFTQFVEWPPSSFSTPQAPLVIGVFGKDPFGSYLKETIAGEKMDGHPLVIQHYSNIEDLRTCHILFINETETYKVKQVIESLKGRSILTVSDKPDFIKNGGMIRLFIENNKTKLRINPEATKAANLVISSKLLRIAEVFVP